MNEAKLYERIGRQHAEIEDRKACYSAVLLLLARVVAGDIEPSRLLINLTAESWELADPGQRPALPATINGLPVCVVAPEKAEKPIADVPGPPIQ